MLITRLFLINSASEDEFLTWITAQKGKRLFQFRPMVPWSSRDTRKSGFLLTPEPATLLLLGLGAVMLRRKRQKQPLTIQPERYIILAS